MVLCAQVVAVKSEAHAQVNPTPDYATHLSAATLNPPAPLAPPVYVPPVPQAAPAAPPPVYAPLPSVTVPLATPQGALPGAPVTVTLPTTPLPQATAGGRILQLPTQPLPQVPVLLTFTVPTFFKSWRRFFSRNGKNSPVLTFKISVFFKNNIMKADSYYFSSYTPEP